MTRQYTITKDNFAEAMSWLKDSLSVYKLSEREIRTARLLVEENLLLMEEYSGADNGTFPAQLSVVRWLGDISVKLSTRGLPYHPLEDVDNEKECEDGCPSQAILKAYRQRMAFASRNGRNTVTIGVYKSAMKRTVYTLSALVVGCLLGLILKAIPISSANLEWLEHNVLDTTQSLFLNVLIMFTTPMIFAIILDAFSGIADINTIQRMGKRLFVFSISKTALFIIAGLFVGHLLGGIPSINEVIPNSTSEQPLTISEMLKDMIPGDIISPFLHNNVIQILLMACFLGIFISRMGEWGNPGRVAINFTTRFLVEVVDVITSFIPILVLVSMTKLVLHTGIESLISMGCLVLCTAVGIPLSLLLSAVIIRLFCRLSPMPFVKKTTKFLSLPFALMSSSACLPDMMELCYKRLGMNQRLTHFLIPVGMQLNMGGTAFYVAIVSMMLAHTYEVNIDLAFCAQFFFVQLLVAPTGIGLIAMPAIFAAFDIPWMAVAVIVGIEPLLDMFGTAHSVAEDISSSFIVCHNEKKVDESVYYSA